MPERVPGRYQDNHSERRVCQILLKLKAPIGGEQHFETIRCRPPEKFSVRHTGPTLLAHIRTL
jgi:hypothetical protein